MFISNKVFPFSNYMNNFLRLTRCMKHFLILLLLCLTTSIHAEGIVCEVDRPSIVERVVNKSNPSVFATWMHEILNEPIPSNPWEWSYFKSVVSRRDLYWQAGFRANVGFQKLTSEVPKMVLRGDDEKVLRTLDERNQIQALNPDFLFIAGLYYYGARTSFYPEDWPYWLRDEAGNMIQDDGWAEMLIDYTLPGAEAHFVEMAVSVAKCGIFDGIFLDLWGEVAEKIPGNDNTAHLYHGNRVEALVSLVKRIREAVGDDFLIIVNSGTRKIPRSAPYVNGAFIETSFGETGKLRERILQLENALVWNEENFRYPQVNCVEVSRIPTEPWDSPANQRWVRSVTSLTLTHSNGYVHIATVVDPDKRDNWYSFWDAPLGVPIGGAETKGVLYETPKGEIIDGIFIREFTGGYAVYNRSGTAQQVYLPEHASGWHSGVKNKQWHMLGDMDGEIYIKSVATLADVNADGIVNILDLVLVANAFNATEPDLNGDGVVNILDLVWVANSIGNRK
ncbi:hypothetical protein F4X88_21675 [Candidatus Poribacteria bacterium]|nr:hypothetical protein [Candidatus Poribacteria bacterium]